MALHSFLSFPGSILFTLRMADGTGRSALEPKVLANMVKALERPDPSLWTYYIIRAVLTGPGVLVSLPYLFFRYHTLRYRFDEEGIHMKVGILFRREINLTYARIQDIHLRSGLLQRWLGLANVEVQTASGSSGAELVIEGFKEYEAIRDFLYTKMRGNQPRLGTAISTDSLHPPPAAQVSPNSEAVTLLLTIRDELRGTRELLEQRKAGSNPPIIDQEPPTHV
jgi:membrane protein YdbS with pleckstrin-like domain